MDDSELLKHKNVEKHVEKDVQGNIDNVVIKSEEAQSGVYEEIWIKQEPLEQDSVETCSSVHDSLVEVVYQELCDNSSGSEHLDNKYKPSVAESSSFTNRFPILAACVSTKLGTNTVLPKTGAIEKAEITENDVSDNSSDTIDERCINTRNVCSETTFATHIRPKNAVSEPDESLTTLIEARNTQKSHYTYKYNSHIEDDENSFVCNLCHNKFTKKSTLDRHMRLHTGENLSECEICEYRCTDNSSLLKHMRTHTGEKPYVCESCPYTCAIKSSLNRHKRTHTGDKPYTCELCPYTCAIKSSLVRHVRTHTKEKPWVCELCQYRCSEASSLVKHMRIHTREKPFACTLCPYASAQNSNLVVHMRTQHRILGRSDIVAQAQKSA